MIYIDSHIHFYEDGKNVPLERLVKIIDFYICNRFKKIIDMGHKHAIGLKLKKIFEGKITIKTCGFALYKDGGYGSFIGQPIRSKKEIPEIINTLSQMGVDFIKVVNSGIVTTNPEIPISKGGFTFEELKMIVEESKSYGLKVKCHVNGDKKIQESIIAGVSSIEHGFFISNETIDMMKEYNVEWTPTVSALLNITKFLQEEETNYIKQIVEDHLEKITTAKQKGIIINIGSDGGSKGIEHIKSYFEELKFINN